MKKFLLIISFFALIGQINKASAQCSGGNVTITNVVLIPAIQQVSYGFDWEYVQGNASIQVTFFCNGTQIANLNCIPRLTDSTAGVHHVSGVYPTTCVGTIKMEIRIWTNPNCGGTYCVASTREVDNSTLPVSFKSFTATRSRSNVLLKWETASEQDNSGFAVERNIGGAWQEIAFVPTQTQSGNSGDILNYSYSDQNTNTGISQYRLRQVDLNGKSKNSEIRSVRGEGQSVKTVVYPNPSADGKVNVVFEDANVTRNVSVIDMSGRVLKQWRNVTNNNLQIENLSAGIYSVRIVAVETGEQVVEKIVVNKR